MPKRKAGAKLSDGRKHSQGGQKPPSKRFFRQRAHVNPLAYTGKYPHPPFPSAFHWERLYPVFRTALEAAADRAAERVASSVTALDIGCGFGGLLFGLKDILPTDVLLGLEIRKKVADFVRLRILAGRVHGDEASSRLAVLRMNAMKYLPCFFRKGQLRKIFICFPDPHFKRSNHRRRITSPALYSEYAFLLAPGARLYTITDVEELHKWMALHGTEHPQFRRLTEEEVAADPCVEVMRTATEEGKKAAREGRGKWVAVFERISDAEAEAKADALPFFDAYYGGVAAPTDETHKVPPY